MNNSIDDGNSKYTSFSKSEHGSIKSIRTNSPVSPAFPQFGEYKQQSTFYYPVREQTTTIPSFGIPIDQANQQGEEGSGFFHRPQETVSSGIQNNVDCTSDPCARFSWTDRAYCTRYNPNARILNSYDPLYYWGHPYASVMQPKKTIKDIFRSKFKKILNSINNEQLD